MSEAEPTHAAEAEPAAEAGGSDATGDKKGATEAGTEAEAGDTTTTTTTAATDGDGASTTTASGEEADYFVGAKVDLAFVLDTTGSMGSYIQSARESINDIAAKIKDEKIDVRFALVPYKDHKDKPLTEVHDFTEDNQVIKLALDKQSATGGGDGPEAVATGLFDARYKLSWRDDASKVIVLIADAPPHGIEKSGDDYPNECPFTEDRKKLIGSSDEFIDILGLIRREIRDELEATIYSVACEPSVSCSYAYCRDFMVFAAECTDGKFLPLSKADLLPPSIIGSIKQKIAMDALESRLEETMAKIKSEYAETHEGKEPTDEEMDDILTKKFQESGVQIDEVDVGEMYVSEPSRENVDLLLNDQECPTLKDFKAKCKVFATMASSNLKYLSSSSPSYYGMGSSYIGGGPPGPSLGASYKSYDMPLEASMEKEEALAPSALSSLTSLVSAPFSAVASAYSSYSAAPAPAPASAPAFPPAPASAPAPDSYSSLGGGGGGYPTPSLEIQAVTTSRSVVSYDSVRKARTQCMRKQAYRSSKMP